MPSDIAVRRHGDTVTQVRVRATCQAEALTKLGRAAREAPDAALWSLYIHARFEDAGDGWFVARRGA